MKKRNISFGVLITLFATNLLASPVIASENPKAISFEFFPKEIELNSTSRVVNFELVAQHPDGIEDESVLVQASGPKNNHFSLFLKRSNNIGIFNSNPVTFKGSFEFSPYMSEGKYDFEVGEVRNYNKSGYQYKSGPIVPKKIREIPSAEYSLLVTRDGFANIDYKTFTGPTYSDSLDIIEYRDKSKFNKSVIPISKVGDKYDPTKYFELNVSDLLLNIKTLSSETCISDGKIMNFIAEGLCHFEVFTEKSKNFDKQSYEETLLVGKARTKPTLTLSELPKFELSDLPVKYNLPQIFSAVSGYVLPKSSTPEVCLTFGFTVQITSGGVCNLTYQTEETSEFLASDLYSQKIEIKRNPQVITFELPSSISLSKKRIQLIAKSTSNSSVSFKSSNENRCKVVNDVLLLISRGNCEILAEQKGTSIYEPVTILKNLRITKLKPRSKIN